MMRQPPIGITLLLGALAFYALFRWAIDPWL